MTQETLREAVARAICLADGCNPDSDWDEALGAPRPAWMLYAPDADAAIATMLERLRTPSERVVDRGAQEFAMTAQRPYIAERNAAAIWQAMLTAFQQENSDER